jgi:hypothetical protein
VAHRETSLEDTTWVRDEELLFSGREHGDAVTAQVGKSTFSARHGEDK